MVETLLNSIEQELDPNTPAPDGDMIRAYNRVRTLLNLAPGRKDVSDALKQVLTGLATIVHGLATMRNKMSDAHGTLYRPARHHAKLAVNSAKTLADFLFETLAYQETNGSSKKHAALHANLNPSDYRSQPPHFWSAPEGVDRQLWLMVTVTRCRTLEGPRVALPDSMRGCL